MKTNSLTIKAEGKTLIAGGDHVTGAIDGAALGSIVEGNPPRFLATDFFNSIRILGPWVITPLLKAFNVILVEADAKKTEGKSANAHVIEKGIDVLNHDGCIAGFPQGKFHYRGKLSPRIYDGFAKMAIGASAPIHVVRLDGFWFKQYPLFISNNKYFRSMVSLFFPNSIQVTLCTVIDLHLKEENKHLTEEEKINLINAELYAYFCHEENLTPDQIKSITKNIEATKSKKKSESGPSIEEVNYLTIWNTRKEIALKERELKDKPEEEQERALENDFNVLLSQQQTLFRG